MENLKTSNVGMQKKRLIIVPLIFTLFGLTLSCSQKQSKVEKNSKESIDNEKADLPQDEVTKVLNLSNGKKIYIRAKIWGISSNHEEIVFSEKPITIPNKVKDYIFYTDIVFYKLDANTLYLYACDCDTSEPKVAFDGVNVVLNDLKTSDQIKDYSANYKKYGLERMSIYD